MKYLILIVLLTATASAKPAKKTPLDKALDQLFELRIGATGQEIRLKIKPKYKGFSFHYIYRNGGMPSDKSVKKILKLFRGMGYDITKYEYFKPQKIIIIQIVQPKKKAAVDLD